MKTFCQKIKMPAPALLLVTSCNHLNIKIVENKIKITMYVYIAYILFEV